MFTRGRLPSVDTVGQTRDDRSVGAEQQIRDELAKRRGDRSAIVSGHTFPETLNLSEDVDVLLYRLGETVVSLHDALVRVAHQIDYLSERMSELEKTSDWIEGKVRRGQFVERLDV